MSVSRSPDLTSNVTSFGRPVTPQATSGPTPVAHPPGCARTARALVLRAQGVLVLLLDVDCSPSGPRRVRGQRPACSSFHLLP